MKTRFLPLLITILLITVGKNLLAQEGYSYRDKCAVYIPPKIVMNKGLHIYGLDSFKGNFRIKIRDKYISIEGKRYYINGVEHEVQYQGNFRRILYRTTYYPPSHYSEKPSNWVITFSGRPDEGWNMTYECCLFNAKDEDIATYSGGPYHLKKGADGNPYCYDCYPDIHNQY